MESDAEFFFIHPRAKRIFGHETYPDLHALGRPIDAVFSAVGAERTVEVVEHAADVGAGGVITLAAGFAELGSIGIALQEQMVAAARRGHMPVIGPNGAGMINVPRKLDLAMFPAFKRRVGGVSAALHSGAMIEAIAASAWRAGGVGLNIMFSAGNEAVTDLADYLDFFVDDPGTRVVVLAVEKIRRPDAFFEAARRCIEAGKPVVALKLGRSERSQRMAASHTGALTGDAWIYDVAFTQAGILPAYDVDDMIDRVQFLEQLPRKRWTSVRGLAVLTISGGSAQLMNDLAEVEGVDIPEAERLKPFIAENIPGVTVVNPLDVTGFIGSVKGLWTKIINEYASAPEFEAILFTHQHAEWDEANGRALTDGLIEAAKNSEKTFVIGPVAGHGGQWLEDYRAFDIAVGNGLRGCLRGLHTMGSFMRLRSDLRVRPPKEIAEIPPPPVAPIPVAEGNMLPFAATMDMLASAGIPVSPYHLIHGDAMVTEPSFPGPYVVKLADVAHRTEHGAVRIKVARAELPAVVEELRGIALANSIPDVVAVQPLVAGFGEAFIGIQGASELGPVVAFGLGGIFVELMRRIGGRMAPMSDLDAAELIDELADTGVLDGIRGAPPWDRNAIAKTLVAASNLAAAGRNWIGSIDINPLIITADGLVAVDGLCLIREAETP